ncbi:MAG: hypothetical protein ACRELB_06035 [Polyangiaceae bacterium]
MTTIHDPIFDVSAPPMYRWGASPLRARGTIYRDAIAMSERFLAKAGLSVERVLRQHGDAMLQAFLSQPFRATDWYDMYPAIHFDPIVARARGVAVAQHMRDAGIAHAEQALRGFTGVVLRLLSNEAVASWLPRISTWYHDFGGIETAAAGEGRVRGVRTGLPVFAVRGWSVQGMQFTEHVLSHVGAGEPRAYALDVEPDGKHEGCPLYRVSFEVSWRR